MSDEWIDAFNFNALKRTSTNEDWVLSSARTKKCMMANNTVSKHTLVFDIDIVRKSKIDCFNSM